MLYGVAYRLLGSGADAEDVLQEAYLRWSDASRAAVREPRRYLTRVVTRLAIDRLRERQREPYVGPWLPEPVVTGTAGDPLETVEQRDTVAMATLYLMERLDPVERAVFVLHSAFDLPYAEIAAVVDRTPAHCRQLLRRATERLSRERARFSPSRSEHARLLESFLTASREGDVAALRATLHRDVVAWSDGGGKVRAALNPVTGVDRVARFFVGVHRKGWSTYVLTEINGSPGAIVRDDRGTRVLGIAVTNGLISGVFLVLNPDKLTSFGAVEVPAEPSGPDR